MTRYVQHNSGKGVKFQVHNETSNRWHCLEFGLPLLLPKSEYVLCEPPEVWKDVTDDFCPVDLDFFPRTLKGPPDYRIRKVKVANYTSDVSQQTWKYAFIIEKKETS